MRRAGRKRKAAPVTLSTVRALAAEPTVTPGRDADAAPGRQAKVEFTAVREAGGRVRIIGSGAATIVQGAPPQVDDVVMLDEAAMTRAACPSSTREAARRLRDRITTPWHRSPLPRVVMTRSGGGRP
ncbi:nitrogenase component 1 [Methylobacterium sp. J-026]|uniref:nitrogenase component 1 n=1 Tax=Methylobacterium sp. J-026 TaxID=2836624 RepID=UPI001FB960C2|nr:nitrogenase component 1 [Methylobacterium sp. J-026]MCJ2135624.1 nitrogenase component 1 [Methylobacterium sp. J-026]